MPGDSSFNDLLSRSNLRQHDRHARARVEDLRENPFPSGDGGLAEHVAATNPHPQYLTEPEGDARYLQSVPAEYLTQTEGDVRYLQDVPAEYLTETEGDVRYLQTVPGEYLTQTEGDARYIRTVNGVGPDASGNVVVEGGGGEPGGGTSEVITTVLELRDPSDAFSWDAMPASLAEWPGDSTYPTTRVRADASEMVAIRIVAQVEEVGVSGSELRLQYTTNPASPSWAYLDGASGPKVALSVAGSALGSWATLVSAAQEDDILLRVVGVGGDGSTTPVLSHVTVQARYMAGGSSSGGATLQDIDDAIDAHEAESDPHPQYVTESEGNALWGGAGGGVTTLDELTDVDVAGAPNGSTLLKVGGVWVDVQNKLGAFIAHMDAQQTVFPHDTTTPLLYGSEAYDQEGWYNTTTGRYTPQQEGFYNLGGSVRFYPAVDQRFAQLYILKNGVEEACIAFLRTSGPDFFVLVGEGLVRANGTTDYFQLGVRHGFGADLFDVDLTSITMSEVAWNANNRFFGYQEIASGGGDGGSGGGGGGTVNYATIAKWSAQLH